MRIGKHMDQSREETEYELVAQRTDELILHGTLHDVAQLVRRVRNAEHDALHRQDILVQETLDVLHTASWPHVEGPVHHARAAELAWVAASHAGRQNYRQHIGTDEGKPPGQIYTQTEDDTAMNALWALPGHGAPRSDDGMGPKQRCLGGAT